MLGQDKEDFNVEKEDFPPEKTLGSNDLEAIYDIPVTVSAVLGRTTMPINQLLRLGRGAVVELDRKIGDSIDILVNNRLIARGKLLWSTRPGLV